MRLEGRRVVVVGVGSSIGAACATRFAHEGASVAVVDPDPVVARDVAEGILDSGGSAWSMAAGDDDPEGANALAAQCDERWHGADGLMICTALLDWWDGDDTPDEWRRLLGANLLGPVWFSRALLPLLAQSGRGSIVYLTSIDGLHGNPTFPAYSISKAGLVPLTHVMAHQAAASRVRVNAIAMAGIIPVGTRPAPDLRQPPNPGIFDVTPLGRPPTADELTSVALFLLGDDASYVTGAVLPVDGGRTAITPGTG